MHFNWAPREDFIWGVASAAQQTEGAALSDGRAASIWDTFSAKRGKIKQGARPEPGTQFYYKFREDLTLARWMGFKAFRYSISWSRIFPSGTGKPNAAGIHFYHQVIDYCLELGLTPVITLYHWDLPQALEESGGWTNPLVVNWFSHYVQFCAREYGPKVKHWIILNEPMGFTTLGYMLGKHAPGRMGLSNFLPAVKHALLAQGEGSRQIRKLVPRAIIGSSFSFSEIHPATQTTADMEAARRIDTLANRLFLEPALGMGLPDDDFFLMDRIRMQARHWRNKDRFHAELDFIGVQNYFPLTIEHASFIPYINAREQSARSRKVPTTALGWEINHDSFRNLLIRIHTLAPTQKIWITEAGACFTDVKKEGIITDAARTSYFQNNLQAVTEARREGVPIDAYFVWTLTDNFEWAEGYQARFGLVYIDYSTQTRIIKSSGYWWKHFLKKQKSKT